MPGVYSTRLIFGRLVPVQHYIVPNGKRAVLKCVTIFNGSGSPQVVTLDIGGTYVWAGTVPVGGTSNNPGLMIVAYAGENIGFAANSSDVYGHVSGYLLDV